MGFPGSTNRNFNLLSILSEYEKAFKSSGIKTQTVSEVSKLSSSDIAIIVNPNNPTGKVIADKTVEDLSKKSLEILDDKNLKVFKDNAFKRAKIYDIEKILPEYIKMYKGVIK